MNEEQPLTKKQRRELRRQEKLEHREQTSRKKMINRIMMWVIVALVLGGIVYALTQAGGNTGSSALLTDAVSADDHIKGIADSQVVLVEYSDFQCPACATYHPIVGQVIDEYQDRIAVVYRHFPLRSIHPNSQISAEASEAAALQGKFWEMYDQLFEKQDEWSGESDPTERFVTYAEEIGLNTDQFRTDLTSSVVTDAVDANYRSGVAASVNGTPTFFLNGTQLDNPGSFDEFRTVIDAALASAGQATNQNTNVDTSTNTNADTANQSTEE